MALVTNSTAHATQKVEGADLRHKQISISMHEQNLLSIEGRRIAHVVVANKNTVVFLKDKSRGALYFALNPSVWKKGTVTFFVTDDQSVVYKLILVPQQMAGEEIILIPPRNGLKDSKKNSSTAKGHVEKIKQLFLLMAGGSSSLIKTQVTPIKKEIPFWQKTQMVLWARYLSEGWVGEKYILKNTSADRLYLTERDLYREGIEAVALESHRLLPGQSTPVYIARLLDSHE